MDQSTKNDILEFNDKIKEIWAPVLDKQIEDLNESILILELTRE